MYQISELKIQQAISLYREGRSVRAVAAAVNIARHTAHRYRPVSGLICPCGDAAGHRHWCEWRLAQSPARQAYYAKCAVLSLARVRPRLEPVLTTWPFVRSFDNNDYALLKAVNDLVPRAIPEHVRADACQDILVDIVSGNLPLESVPHRVKEYIARAYEFTPSKFGPLSLDSFVFGNEGRTLADVLEG